MKDLEPLWKIEDELAAIADTLEAAAEEFLPELERRLAEYLTYEAEKVDRVDAVFRSLEAVQQDAAREIDRLRMRSTSAERALQRLEQYVLRVLHGRDGQPLKGRNVTLSIRHSHRLIIDSTAAVPEKFKRITIDVPKAPVKQAIASGEQVPGAHIEPHESLQRR
jgi:hypothetical protein